MKPMSLFLAAVIGITACNLFAQSHGHLEIGAIGTNQGDQLFFDNGAIFETNTGYVLTLTPTNAGTYAGYFQSNVTLTALAGTSNFGGPDPNAPALGSRIYAQIVSVEGPTGGEIAFWESGATNPTISLACGATGTNAFVVSANNGDPSTDPFGHIHGRRITATIQGIYLVGLRAIDGSTNGTGGGPIHTPSEILKFHVQAGFNIASISRSNGVTSVAFGTAANRTFHLESSAQPEMTNSWSPAGSIAGNDAFRTLAETNAADGRFYRIRISTP